MQPEQNPNWQYSPGGQPTATVEPPQPASPPTTGQAAPPPPAGPSVSWTASEYIEHQRGADWYLMLFGGTIALAAITYFITKDYFATSVMVILGVIVAAFSRHRPKQIDYELNDSGVNIGPKSYPYRSFKSFAVMRDEAVPSIMLMPLKRFMPPISIYFAEPDEEPITSVLGAHLPYEDQKPDQIDRLSRRLKF